MENKAHALAAGLFVVAIAALMVAMTLWLRRDTANTLPYEMVSKTSVTGLQEQAQVRFKGVAVGRVTGIGFDPQQRSNVLIKLAIDDDAPVSEATFATLAFQGVTGLSFVQLNDDGTSNEPLAPGPNGIPRIPLRASALGELTDQASSMMVKLDQAADGINHLLDDENQAAFTQALKGINTAAASASQLAQTADETLRAQFGPKNTDIPALVRQATATLKAAEGTVVDARQTLAELDSVIAEAKQGLAHVTESGGVLDRIDAGANTLTRSTLPGIENLTTEATHTVGRLDRLASGLSDNPQALLFGRGPIPPGPGEPGFVTPTAPASGAAPQGPKQSQKP